MGLSTLDLKHKIQEGDIPAAYILAKDPNRQNLQEEFQKNYINTKVGFDTLTILPKQNNYRFSNNETQTKSADATVSFGDKEFLATMKLISGSGGAQDNQRADAKLFLTIGSKKADVPVIAIIDDTHPKASEYYLNGVNDRKKAYAFTSDSLIEYIKYNK